MRHSINDALTLRFSAISHLLFIGGKKDPSAMLGMTMRENP